MSMEQIFQDINKMRETTYTLRLGQLLKVALNLNKYMWHKLQLEKPNIDTKVILKLSVAIMIEKHSKINTVAIKVNNQMVIIQVQVGKNTIEDVLLNGGASVNIITQNLKTKLGSPKPRLTPYHLKMVDQSMTRPLGIIQNLKIQLHVIPYVTTFIVLQNNVVDFSYSMLLRRPWLGDAKVRHDQRNTVITVQGKGTIRTISINKKLGSIETRRLQVLVYYDLMEGLTNEEEDLIFEIEPKMFSIGIITISNETVSWLSVRVTYIKINGESKPKQGISDQGATKVVASTTKTIEFNVRP